MKHFFKLFFLFAVFTGWAQRPVTITVNWTGDTKWHSESMEYNIPQFNPGNLHFDNVSQKLSFNYKFKSEGPIDVGSLQISNVQYENIREDELGDLDRSNIPSGIEAKLDNSLARGDTYGVLSFSPIIKSGGGYRKVKVLTFSYSLSAARYPQTAFSTPGYTSVYNSVLATGSWYRFYVEKSGVYKISRTFLQQLGMNVNNLDPRRIKIYGHGGRMAPLLNSEEYHSDLVENAIQIIGEADGTFDADDYILFYAEGVDNWNDESQTHLNLYEERAYYYITAHGDFGKRIQENQQPSGGAVQVINTFNGYYFHERDLINIGRLGRKWFGEQFGVQNTSSFTFAVPNVVPGSQMQVQIALASVSFSSSSFSAAVNGQSIGMASFTAISSSSSGVLFREGTISSTLAATDNISLQLTYNNNGVPSARGYLDHIRIRTVQSLLGIGKQFRFRYDAAAALTGIGEYQVGNASGIPQVWDVTDIYNVTSFQNSGQNTFSFKAFMGQAREYIVLDPSDYFTPQREASGTVPNQNLKGTVFLNAQGQFQDVDYLIVTPSALYSEAERLANFHRSYSQMNVKVARLEQIYHEFSSGKQDIAAIRNFVKYIYYNASAPDKRIKYLNLFGEASFDYKNRVPENTNIVPIFHALQSNSNLTSIMSDDFYGMMDPDEGRLIGNNHSLDVAVGRMLVGNLQDARQMVDKVLEYHDPQSYGRWRNNFTLVSDDADNGTDFTLQQQLDNLGEELIEQKPFVNLIKIHSDSYVQESSSGGQRYPKVKEDIVNTIELGTLVLNYFGHGGEEGLASERIFEKTEAQNLTNRYRYPLFVTITCEFTRFDNPFRPTAGELTYKNPRGGAISMVTTTRLITVVQGRDINLFFSSFLYGYDSEESITISEALRQAKNNYSISTYMVFYIGDPALKLAIPKPKVKLTKLNDVPVEQSTDTLKALSRIRFDGEVTDELDQLLNTYNGELSVQVFDKKIQRTTLGNDGYSVGGVLQTMDFETLGETIFRGNATVANGRFSINFVVPRDIRMPVDSGKVSFYAKRSLPAREDQTGYNLNILVGGVDENAPVDTTPPTVRLYMNDESFISGGITNSSPVFLAFLEDESGINTASGIGHDIIAILDGDESNPYVLNDYYETELDDYTRGSVRFPFRDLELGMHTITFRAWDVYNNPVTAEIQFLVVGDEGVVLTNVLNYPNPFVSYTQFWFTHNRPFEPLDVQVQILTVTGKVVKTINQTVATDGFLSREISWDGRDDFGDRIGKGVYVYKLTVRSTVTNKRAEKYEKLVIL